MRSLIGDRFTAMRLHLQGTLACACAVAVGFVAASGEGVKGQGTCLLALARHGSQVFVDDVGVSRSGAETFSDEHGNALVTDVPANITGLNRTGQGSPSTKRSSNSTQPMRIPRAKTPVSGPMSMDYARLPFAWEHMSRAPAVFRHVLWPVAIIANLFSVTMTVRLALQHLRVGEELRVASVKVFRPEASTASATIVLLFPTVSLTCLFSLMGPRNTVLMMLAWKVWEGLSLFAFFRLLVSLMGNPEEAVAQMEREEPFKLYGVPPLCCFYPCVPRIVMNRDRFVFARNLVVQYCFIGPFAFICHAWNSGYVPWLGIKQPDTWLKRHILGLSVKIVSTMLCFWGLFQLYMATRSRLNGYNTTLKFALIKGMLVLVEFVDVLMHTWTNGYNYSDDPAYSDAVVLNSWTQMIICVLVVPFSVLALYAFPVSDILRAQRMDQESQAANSILRRAKSAMPAGAGVIGSGGFVYPNLS